ncbi:MAG: hypothetical protein GXY94_03800 [Bacteroidales bacterium]|nr:hypothetical protein [Bacteroidales bacterium]
MKFTELLTTYWSQVLIVLAGLGYLLKRILDIRSKKTETNHSLFQQNKISSINRFFENYSKSELMWNQIAIYDILERKLSPKEIDKIIFPVLNELDKNLLELMIYFDEKEIRDFKIIVENIKSINRALSSIYFDYAPDKTIINKSNEFTFAKEKVLLSNGKILIELAKYIKQTFK